MKIFFIFIALIMGILAIYEWLIVGDIAKAGLNFGIGAYNMGCYLMITKKDNS